MKTATAKKVTLTSIQLILLLFTIIYGVTTLAATVHTAKHTVVAKGQKYVPPQNSSHCA